MEIYEYWLALPTMYGPETMGHIAFGDLIFDTLYTTMKDTDLFASTISQLEIDWTEAHFSDEMKSAILFSDGSNKFKYQFLPQRFNSALQYVRTNNLSYDAAKNYLRVQDQLLPRAPQVIAPSTQVNAVQQQKKRPSKPTSSTTHSTSDDAKNSLVVHNTTTPKFVHVTIQCELCDNPTNGYKQKLCQHCNKEYHTETNVSKDQWVKNRKVNQITSSYDKVEYLDDADYEDEA